MKDLDAAIPGAGGAVRDGPDALRVRFSCGRRMIVVSVVLTVAALLALAVLSFPMELRTVDWWPVQGLGYLACAAGVAVLLAWVVAEAWLLVEYRTTVTIAVAPCGITITHRSPLGLRERLVAPGEVRSVEMHRSSAGPSWIRYDVALHPLVGRPIRICASAPPREAQVVYNLLLGACGRPLDLERQRELEREWRGRSAELRRQAEAGDWPPPPAHRRRGKPR